MNKKLPSDAYAFYVSLGQERSYDAVATKFDVCERTVAEAAKRERWQERIADQERRARDRVDEKAVETLAQMSERHLKVLRFMEGKAIETMKERPLDSCMDAMKAFVLAIDKERLIRGEPTDRTANLEEICRREYDRWLVKEDTDEKPANLNAPGEPQPEHPASLMSPGTAEASDELAESAVQPEADDEAPGDPEAPAA
jgi:hypothetical protein